MQKFTLTLDMVSTMRSPEQLADALRQAANKVQSGTSNGKIRDAYGDFRGEFNIVDAADEPEPGEDEDPGPDPDNDGFIWHGQGHGRMFGQGYDAMIFGHSLSNAYGFPTAEIAMYELAKAMAEAGEFPAAWFEGEHGPSSRNIEDEVRRFHDEGSDTLLPLSGVQYAEGDQIYEQDYPGEIYTVDRDYGTLGIITCPSSDQTVQHYVKHEQRNQWAKVPSSNEN